MENIAYIKLLSYPYYIKREKHYLLSYQLKLFKWHLIKINTYCSVLFFFDIISIFYKTMRKKSTDWTLSKQEKEKEEEEEEEEEEKEEREKKGKQRQLKEKE